MKTFYEKLEKLRKENGLTQQQMATLLGIKQPSYARYEDGTTEPNLERLIIIADTFDVSVDYLLGRKEY